MKLITLNLWGGRVKSTYKDFFTKYPSIDIWCFQEVYKNVSPGGYLNINEYEIDSYLHDTLKQHLDSHQVEFCQVLDNFYGIATFVNKDIKIIDRGEMLVAKGDWWNLEDGHNRDHHRKLQWLEIEIKGKKMILANVHLTHRPEGKSDSDKRLKQSKLISDFLKMFDYPKILVGDFNLLPDTESIKIIEDSGMINLIKENKVTSTRTELYKKPLRFADYIFVSPEIKVNEFKVLEDVVSDHSPLFIDFDL